MRKALLYAACALPLACRTSAVATPDDQRAATSPSVIADGGAAGASMLRESAASASPLPAAAPVDRDEAFHARPIPGAELSVVLDGNCEELRVSLRVGSTWIHDLSGLYKVSNDQKLILTSSPPDLDVIDSIEGDFPDHAWLMGHTGSRSATRFHAYRWADDSWKLLFERPNGQDYTFSLGSFTHARVRDGMLFATDPYGVESTKTRLRADGIPVPKLDGDLAPIDDMAGFPSGEIFAIASPATGAEVRYLAGGKPMQTFAIPTSIDHPSLLAIAPNELYVVPRWSQSGVLPRFDGTSWSMMTLPAGLKEIDSVHHAANGALWLVSDATVWRRATDGSFTSFSAPAPFKRVAGVEQNAPWALLENGQVVKLVGGKWQFVHLPKPPFNPTLSYQVNSIEVRDAHDVWITAEYRYAPSTDQFDGSHSGVHDAVLRTIAPDETLRCPDLDQNSSGEAGVQLPSATSAGLYSSAPAATDECTTPLLIVAQAGKTPTDYPRSRTILRKLRDASPASGAIVEEVAAGSNKLLAVKVSDVAAGRRLAKAFTHVLAESSPFLMCATLPPVRVFASDADAGAIVDGGL